VRPSLHRIAGGALLLLGLQFLGASAPAAESREPAGPYWIFLRARDGTSPEAAGAPALSPRAIARREKARRERAAAPALDAPPPAAYRDAIAGTGARLRAASGWLNAVSVEADASALERIRALPFVAEIVPVAVGGARQSPAPPEPPAAWSDGGDAADAGPSYAQLALAGIPEAHALGYHGEGVLIGVLDTGFTLGHEAFDRIETRARRDFVQEDGDTRNDRARTPPDPPTQHDHGTQVLSLLAAYAPGRMIGAAYGASFLLAKTERTDVEKPFEEDIWCAGLEWAEAEGADVITTSITFDDWYRLAQLDGRTAVVTRMANAAWERGVVLVNSAGNYGPRPSTLGAPADAPGVISVGATDLEGRIAGFSSRGPTGDGRVKPDVTAPGANVLVADSRTRDGYTRGGGTSYSAPIVAGVAALVVQAHPDWGPEAVREAVVMSGDRANQPANEYGWGMVNARSAILYPFLEGTVRDRERGAPIPNATVSWEREESAPGGSAPPGGAAESSGREARWAAPGDGPARGEIRAGAGGGYTIANLPPGRYRLTVRAEGFTPETIGPFEVPPNLDGVDVSLAPAR
jgi:subtilisin family serine protease